ncbi:MAG: PAS domain S-box protein, partial [Bacteroidota bacterium]
MEQEYRILIVEDLPSDAMLVEYELKKALQRFTVQIVENESDYLKGLEEFKPDLIISDYQLPGFNGLTALKIAIEKSPLTPVIIATGSMNEETAVQCMKAGASDYVIKEHLRRLGPAVISALDQKKIKSEKILAESALREKEEELRKSEERYRTVSRLSSEFAYTCITDNKGGYKVDWITDAFFSLTGYSESELKEQGCWMFVTHPDDREMATKPLRELNPGETDKKEFRILTREGVILYIINYLECMTDPHLRDGKRLYGAVTDITERKRAENKISQVTENWNKTFDAIQDGISLIDENHHIIQSNKSFLEFVKRSPADLQEKNCFFMVHGTLCPIQGCPFVRMKHSRKRESMEMSVNGLVCEIMVDPIFDETGNITGAVHILKNITESKKTERIKQVLFDISNAVVTTHDVEELIGIIREQLGKLVDTSNFYVAFYDEATGILSSPYVQDEKDGITTWPAAMSLTGCVIEQDKPILLTMEEIQDMANKGIIEMIGVPSACWLGVPLRIDGKVIGAFVVQSYD